MFEKVPLEKVLKELSAYFRVELTANHVDNKMLTAGFEDRSLDEIIYFIEADG